MLTLSGALAGLPSQQTIRQALLWHLETLDGGIVLRYTDHDQPLIFFEGDNADTPREYTPFYGWDVSARQLQAGLQEANLDTLGIISDDQITVEDLRAGRWSKARITERLVDWRFPHRGAFRTRRYSIGRVRWTGETWEAEVNGLPNKLHARQGRSFVRNCDATYGYARCGSDKDSFTTDNVRVLASSQDADEPRRVFQAVTSDLPSQSDGYYDYSELRWVTGDNANHAVISQVKVYLDASRDIELYEPTPFNIADNDRFDLVAGCDLLFSTCRDKFANGVNYRGFHLMPSTERVLKPVRS